MIILEEDAAKRAELFIETAADLAITNAKCLKSKHGILLVRKGIEVIGRGYNSPPDEVICDKCLRDYFKKRPSTTEPCRAIHAEERAIIDAFQKGFKNLEGTIMYHARIKNGQIATDNTPSCSQCSKRNAKLGISFVMRTLDGISMYFPEEFNRLTLDYVLGQRKK